MNPENIQNQPSDSTSSEPNSLGQELAAIKREAGTEWTPKPGGGWERKISQRASMPETSSRGLAEGVKAGWIRDRQTGEWIKPGVSTEVHQNVPETKAPLYEKDQMNKNLDLLKNSDFGALLKDAYEAAVRQDPRLANIEIVPYEATNGEQKSSPFARRVENGKYQVHIPTGEIGKSFEFVNNIFEDVPGFKKMIAEKMSLYPGTEPTFLQTHVYIMLHEMGHCIEFMNADNEGGYRMLKERQQAEKEALPLPNIRTSELIKPNSQQRQWVEQNWPQISQSLGVNSITELADLKNRAHRNMTSERFADNFASTIFEFEPTLVEQLGSDDIERYRNLKA